MQRLFYLVEVYRILFEAVVQQGAVDVFDCYVSFSQFVSEEGVFVSVTIYFFVELYLDEYVASYGEAKSCEIIVWCFAAVCRASAGIGIFLVTVAQCASFVV